MLSWARVLAVWLLLLLAGCSSSPRWDHSSAPDWEYGSAGSTTVQKPVTPAPLNPKASLSPVVAEPAPAGPVMNPLPSTWIPLSRWCQSSGLKAPVQVAPMPSAAYSVATTNGALLMRVGTSVAKWDGVELHLGFPPQIINREPYIHTLDLQKTIVPLVYRPEPLETGSSRVIVIDPGHGGENAGTRSVLGHHYEKEYTLDWALRLQSLLATVPGLTVILTRSNDVDLALSNRVAFAEAHNAGLFLSLHFNSAGPENVDGLETYCLTPVGMPSNLVRGSDEAAETFPNNAFDAKNLQLAMRVHRALLQVNGHYDRGVRRARFPGVLRGQRCPAILVEGGYLSSPREARMIANPAYRQKLAEALAMALMTQSARPVPDLRASTQSP